MVMMLNLRVAHTDCSSPAVAMTTQLPCLMRLVATDNGPWSSVGLRLRYASSGGMILTLAHPIAMYIFHSATITIVKHWPGVPNWWNYPQGNFRVLEGNLDTDWQTQTVGLMLYQI